MRNYWGIVGYGVCLDDIREYLNKDKLVKEIKNIYPEEDLSNEEMLDDLTFYGRFYNSFAEFLIDLDDRNILTWNDDGDTTEYLLYTPTYPWRKHRDEFETEQEAHDYIIKILQRVYDGSEEELGKHIGYISTWGCS